MMAKYCFSSWNITTIYVLSIEGTFSMKISKTELSRESVILMNTPTFVVPHTGTGSHFFLLGSVKDLINNGYVRSSIASFMLWWIAAVAVLRHYSEKSRTKTALDHPEHSFNLFFNSISAFIYKPVLIISSF
jgi:hypothetical protein